MEALVEPLGNAGITISCVRTRRQIDKQVIEDLVFNGLQAGSDVADDFGAKVLFGRLLIDGVEQVRG